MPLVRLRRKDPAAPLHQARLTANPHLAAGGRDREASLRIALITQWFPPEPAPLPLWIAESLRRQGLQVGVVTGVPTVPTAETRAGRSRWRSVRQTQDGFPVLRAPLYRSHDRSAIGRTANYVTYALSSAIVGAPILSSADVSLVYCSPATAATAAMVARLRFRTPYVLLVTDLWPDSVFATGFLTEGPGHRLAEAGLTSFTRTAYHWASRIAAISPGMRDLLIDRGVPASKVSVVYTWANEAVLHHMPPDQRVRGRLGIDGDFVLMYAGNHGPAQALDVPIRAMAKLRDLPDIHLVLIGDGIDKPALRALAQQLDLRSVHFVDSIDQEAMPAVMASADMQLVSLADHDLFRVTLPSKVQSILACRQPILACAPGDAAQLVEDAGAGLTCPPGDPDAFAQAVRRAHDLPKGRLRDMGRAGFDYYRSTLSEAVNGRALADLLRVAAEDRRNPSHG
jgi:glycosyltransferase involved in cell wall biosynthesis